MKLIEKKVKPNPETFAPELLVTVSLPLELMNTDPAPGEEAMAYEKIGAEFVELLKADSK
jgi:hypothetical protein